MKHHPSHIIPLLLIALAIASCQLNEPTGPGSKASSLISSIQIEAGDTVRLKKQQEASFILRIEGERIDSVLPIILCSADRLDKECPYCRIVSIHPLAEDYTIDGISRLYEVTIADACYSAEYTTEMVFCYPYKTRKGATQYVTSEPIVAIGHHYNNLVRTGLPVMIIETPNRQAITSKDTYIDGAWLTLLNADMTYDADAEMQIRGRGNSTWTISEKKPYRIKFAEKQSLQGEKADRNWALLANYCDKTQIRNALGLHMGTKSVLDFTPAYHYVELILNGHHRGTYMLVETVRASKHRVDVGDDGYLMEVDMRAASPDVYFRVSTIRNPVVIKSPETTKGSPEYQYIKNRFDTISGVLFGSDFKDPDNGYRKYIDVDSWIDWALINEIGRNGDAAYNASIFMNMKKGEKLKMGPLWDFDLAYGNYKEYNNSKIEGLYIFKSRWLARMMEDPYFRTKAKERMNYFNEHRQDWMDMIDEQAASLDESQQANEAIWHTMNQSLWPGYTMYTTYDQNVQEMKIWINQRMDWLQNEFQSY